VSVDYDKELKRLCRLMFLSDVLELPRVRDNLELRTKVEDDFAKELSRGRA